MAYAAKQWCYPLVVVDQAAPVQHVHHGLEAEQRLVPRLLGICRQGYVTCCQLDCLISFCPCKLLQPDLSTP